MIDQIKEFAYLQENPTYQQDWDAAFWGYQEERTNFSLTPEEVRKRVEITLVEIGPFVNSPRGFALATKYGLCHAYYYGLPLGEQLKAIHDVDLDKALPNSISIFLSGHLPLAVRVISHAPARIRGLLQPGYILRDNRYLTVEIDIICTDQEILRNLKALLNYYREQIGPVRQEKKSRPHYDPLKVWKLVKGKSCRSFPENREANSILWQVAGELDSDQNAYDLSYGKPKTANKEDSLTQNEIYKKLQKVFQLACHKILSFTPSKN
jgi:hypothetical protein